LIYDGKTRCPSIVVETKVYDKWRSSVVVGTKVGDEESSSVVGETKVDDEGTSVVGETKVDDEGTSVVGETMVDEGEACEDGGCFPCSWGMVDEGKACDGTCCCCSCPLGGLLLLEWRVPATTPPTMPPTMTMMRAITPMPHRVQYHGTFSTTGSCS
jgi:hypothetical protein